MDRKTAQNSLDEIAAIMDHIQAFNAKGQAQVYFTGCIIDGLEEMADALGLTRTYCYVESSKYSSNSFIVVSVKYKDHELKEYQDVVRY